MSGIVDPAVNEYVLAHSSPADEVLRDLAAETRATFGGSAGMQVSQDEGALLTMLVRLIGARTALEVGVFTGYSSISIARGLPKDGRLLACDQSAEFTAVARRYWERAGVAEKIELRLAPAIDTLRALPPGPQFDFAFVDADKGGYRDYYAEVLPRLRAGGLLVLDNMLRGGRVLTATSGSELVIRELNAEIAADPRVDVVLMPVRDGVSLVRKRD